MSAEASTLHALSFGFNLGYATRDARDRCLSGKGVVTVPPILGPFLRSVGAKSTAHSWHIDPSTPFQFLVLWTLVRSIISSQGNTTLAQWLSACLPGGRRRVRFPSPNQVLKCFQVEIGVNLRTSHIQFRHIYSCLPQAILKLSFHEAVTPYQKQQHI